MAIKYLEKEKKVLNTEESIEHGTVAINYLEKILEKKKKKKKDTTYREEHRTRYHWHQMREYILQAIGHNATNCCFFKRSYTPYF